MSEMIAQARQVLTMGAKAMLAKGGHSDGEESVDFLVEDNGASVRLSTPRLNVSMRGTGCALSTAIAAGLARGLMLREVCALAKDHVRMLMKFDTQFSLKEARSP